MFFDIILNNLLHEFRGNRIAGMENQFSRTELIYGKSAIEDLHNKKVAVFGVGGVGGYVIEALARTGISHFVIVDFDTVSISNINRQIIATHDTIGKYKVDVMRDRILSINPEAEVDVRKCFFLPENESEFDFREYDYVVDAVDTVSAKIAIVMKANEAGVPVISSMGAGNKVDPSKFLVSDIYKTDTCPLARVMRHEMKKRGVKHLKVVYSKEQPIAPLNAAPNEPGKKVTPGSVAFAPAAAGLLIASEVIKDLTNFDHASRE